MKNNCWLIVGAMLSTSLLAQQTTNTTLPAPIETPAAAPAATLAPATATTKAPAAKAGKKKAGKEKEAAPELKTVPLVAGLAVVVASNGKVRGQAKLKSEVVTRVTKGQMVTVVEEIVRSHSGPEEPSAWAKILLPPDAHVWVNSSFIDATNKTVRRKRLSLRSGPGENYSVIGLLERGEAVKELNTKGDWMEIEPPPSAYAFMASQYLKQEAPAVAAASSAVVPQAEAPAVAVTPATAVAASPTPPAEPPPAPAEVAAAPAVAPPPTAVPTTTPPAQTPVVPTPVESPAFTSGQTPSGGWSPRLSPQPSPAVPDLHSSDVVKAAATNAPKSEVMALREGDTVRISFPGAPSLNTVTPIRRDGMITLQLIGEFKAAGLTPTQLEKELVKLYGPQLQTKEVTVAVESSAFPIYVSGAVLRPGKIMSDRPMTALEAIMEAGGFDYTKANLKAVRVLRTVNGRTEHYLLNLKGVLQGHDPGQFSLKPLDIIYVPERFSWF